MLKRKIEKKLIAWKNTENRKPLIINVAKHFLFLISQRKIIKMLCI